MLITWDYEILRFFSIHDKLGAVGSKFPLSVKFISP